MNGKTIAKKLHEIQNAISGATNHAEIREIMNAFGYTGEHMEEGRILLENVNKLMVSQVDNYGDKYAASEDFSKQWDKAYADYMVILKIIRVVFKGDIDALTSFKATGQRSRTISGWIREARIMYSNLLEAPGSLSVLERYGINQERINKGLQQVNEIEALYSKQLEKKGDAQQSTLDRDKVLDELINWYSDFRAIARIALYEKPQLLEALGIVKK